MAKPKFGPVAETAAEVKAPAPQEPVQVSSIEQRRREAWQLRVRGVPVSVIAKTFGVTDDTIYKDLKRVTEELAGRLLDEGPVGIMAKAYARYDHLRDELALMLENENVFEKKLKLIAQLKEIEDSQSRLILSMVAMPRAKRLPLEDKKPVQDGEEFTTEQASSILQDVIDTIKGLDGKYVPKPVH